MSVSRECAALLCAFYGELNSDSGSPVRCCVDLIRMPDQALIEKRFAIIAESALNGKLLFEQLSTGDIVHIISSTQGHAYKDNLVRELRFQVVMADKQRLTGIVIADSYNAVEDLDRRCYALAPGSVVTFLGAYEVRSKESEQWVGDRINGQFHVGRYIEYEHPDYDTPRVGLYLQEIVLSNQDQTVSTHVFGTNPLEHRNPPPFIQ